MAVLALFAAFGPAAAQTSVKLVGNTSFPGGNATLAFDYAQAFTTGSHGLGYKLTSARIRFREDPSLDATSVTYDVSIRTDAAGLPGATLGTLTNPAALADGLNTYTASGGGIDLAANTTYWVVFDVHSVGNPNKWRISITTRTAEDPGAAAGWSIADDQQSRANTATTWAPFSFPTQMEVHGYAKTPPPPLRPGRPSPPVVTTASETSLTVSWSAPSGGAAVTDYDLRYYAGTADPADPADWIEEGEPNGPPDPGTSTTATITGLSPGTSYRVQVRAASGGREGPWSGSGATAAAVTLRSGFGGEGSPVTFTAQLSRAVGSDVVLGWSTGPDEGPYVQGATPGEDYTPVTDGRVTIPAGETRATFSVETLADSREEEDETFRVTIVGIDLPEGVVIAEPSAVGTILGRVDLPPLNFVTVEGGSAAEGSPVTFTAMVSPPAGSDVVLRWVTSRDHTRGARQATPGSDYTAVSDGRVRIAAGATEATFSVATVQDTLEEGDETFRVIISEFALPDRVGIETWSAVGTIEDYTPPPNEAPAFEPSEYAFELRENVDGSAQPVGLGTVSAADPDGDELSYELASGDASRFAVGEADGAVSYTGPGEDYETEPNVHELTVRASDPAGASAEALVTVTVVNENELPGTADDAASTDEDVAVTVDVLANDTDVDGDSLRVASVSAPENGTTEVTAAGGVLYTPAANWHGTDRFTYTAEDGNGGTSEASVEVTVRPVNDVPEAAGDTASTNEDEAVAVDVLANDTDVDGDSLRVASVSAPENGTAAVAVGGVLYTPSANWHGTDSFTYEVDDGNGGTASASVEVTVSPVNDVPEAAGDSASTVEDEAVTVDVLANDTDPDGDGLRVASVSAPENGTTEVTAGGVLYTPEANWHGTDRFTYVADDGNGGTAEASVEVTVSPANDAPVAVGTIPAQSLEEGGEAVRIELGPFFDDLDGDALSYSTVSSDPSVAEASVAGTVLTLVPVGYGTATVKVCYNEIK